MILFPAIDLYEGKAVRLYKGDYAKMTVYSDDPPKIGETFAKEGAKAIHIVDLEGAKNGTTPNFEVVKAIKSQSGLFCEIGGGIRSMQVVEQYLTAGMDRVILGTAAVSNPEFLKKAIAAFREKIVVGVDIKDGFVAVKGWTEKSERTALDFCSEMQDLGVKTIIVTDISKDGAMQGANHDFYLTLMNHFKLQIVASGGVSSLKDVQRLAAMDLYGAIIGKAYYTGDILLPEALACAEREMKA